MNKLHAIIIILMLSLNIQAQHFNNALDVNQGAETGLSLLQLDSNCLVSWGGAGDGGSRFGYMFLDSNGLLTSTKTYVYKEKSIRGGIGALVKSSDNRLVDIRTAQRFDSLNNLYSEIMLIFSDLNGDTIGINWFTDSLTNNLLGYDLIETTDSGFIILGERLAGNDYDPLVIKVDFNGSELWRKIIYDKNGQDRVGSIALHPNGDYYIGGSGNSQGRFKTWLIRIDDSANVKFIKHFNSSAGRIGHPSVLIDSTLIIGTDTLVEKIGVDEYRQNQLIVVEPKNGELQWNLIHGATSTYAGYNQVLSDETGNLYARSRYVDDLGGTGYSLTKLNPFGDTIWMNNYWHEYKGDHSAAYEVIRSRDDGFVLTGTTHPSGRTQDTWVLKVDSNGCQTPACESRVYDVRLGVNLLPQLYTNFKLFPNPVADELTVTQESEAIVTWKYSLIDVQGKEILSGKFHRRKNHLNLNQIAPGNYTLILVHGPVRKGYKVLVAP